MFSNEESINNLGESTYQGIVDSIMVELQQKYILRPREMSTTSTPPKQILLRNKVNEAIVTKQTTQAKKVETKATQTKKTKNIKTQTSTRECEKTVGGFSLENKINKIKIPMPLVELSRNPIYKK